MLELNACRIDATLTQCLDDAMTDIARLEENHALCPIQGRLARVSESPNHQNQGTSPLAEEASTDSWLSMRTPVKPPPSERVLLKF
jgi:hypothetical protein